MAAYDAIVLGTGGVGSAALWQLARRGLKVLGIDRFEAGHDRGSSHGQTRIIRQAYFEHPDYVPLLKRAYELWAELESARGEKLFHQVGLLEIGPADGVVVPGVLESARRYDLEVDELSPSEAARRFAGFQIPEGSVAVFERRAGYLLVERCVKAHIEEATKLGAELRIGASAKSWSVENGTVKVETDAGSFQAARLILTAGAWTGQLCRDLGVPLRVLRKHLHWFACDDPRFSQDGGCPTFFYETPQGYFYGFPRIDERGVKFAEHSGGELVADPLHVDRSLDQTDLARIDAFRSAHLPGVSANHLDHAVCMYTVTPDEHFIVDRHPQHEQVVIAAGLSGHGFKFAGVLGEALTDLSLAGVSDLPIDFLRLNRPGLKRR